MSDYLPSTELPAEIRDLAIEVMGSPAQAKTWFGERAMGLNGNRPRDLLRSPGGEEIVRDFLMRLKHNVYI